VTPEKLTKIRALANDDRGDPATRMVAQRVLARYAKEEPPRTRRWAPPHVQHPGLRTSPEYDRYMFMDLANWGESSGGNPIHTTSHNGLSYTIVLFEHKRTPTYGWMRTRTGQYNDKPDFSLTKYSSLGEAHRAAWDSLRKL
jgi:hypothetical protein